MLPECLIKVEELPRLGSGKRDYVQAKALASQVLNASTYQKSAEPMDA